MCSGDDTTSWRNSFSETCVDGMCTRTKCEFLFWKVRTSWLVLPWLFGQMSIWFCRRRHDDGKIVFHMCRAISTFQKKHLPGWYMHASEAFLMSFFCLFATWSYTNWYKVLVLLAYGMTFYTDEGYTQLRVRSLLYKFMILHVGQRKIKKPTERQKSKWWQPFLSLVQNHNGGR